jgi:hypothetical protein
MPEKAGAKTGNLRRVTSGDRTSATDSPTRMTLTQEASRF